MTYFLTALTNDRAQLIVHTLQTTDRAAATAVKAMWETQGYRVVESFAG